MKKTLLFILLTFLVLFIFMLFFASDVVSPIPMGLDKIILPETMEFIPVVRKKGIQIFTKKKTLLVTVTVGIFVGISG